jgi:hypothetical protein
MTVQRKRLAWFVGIYICSLIVFAFVTYMLRAALRLL